MLYKKPLAVHIHGYIFVVAPNIALDHWCRLRREELPGDVPEMVVDPLPRLEARSALRALPKPAYLHAIFECLAAGASLHVMADALGIPPGTITTRLRSMRAARRK